MKHGVDVGTFMAWGLHLAEVGPRAFWNDGYWCDYLPGYLYVLGAVGAIAHSLSEPLRVLAFKLPNILADIATAWLIWRVSRPLSKGRGLLLPAIYLFNPAVFGNSTLWGQVDSFHALCLTASLYLLSRSKPIWAAALIGYALSIKPHTIVILPLVLLYALCTRVVWWRIVVCVVLAVAVLVATFVPFHTGSLVDLPAFVRERIDTTMGQYGYSTVNAMNLWYLLGLNWKQDSSPLVGDVSVRHVSIALSATCQLLAAGWFLLRRRKGGDTQALWEAASIIFLCTFLFVTRAHERHVFPFFAMAAMAAAQTRATIVPYAAVSLAYTVNLGLSWAYLLQDPKSTRLCGDVLGAAVCILYLLALPMLVASFACWGADRWAKKQTHSPIATSQD